MLFAVVLVASLVFASLMGHVIHWLLHQPQLGIAHRAHMQHHTVHYPPGHLVSDAYKKAAWYHSGVLLFTPPFLLLVLVFGTGLWLLHAPGWLLGVFAGSLLGFGLFNDAMHDSFHVRKHWLRRFNWYRRLCKLHFFHHLDMTRNFGITFFGWDALFGTKATTRQ